MRAPLLLLPALLVAAPALAEEPCVPVKPCEVGPGATGQPVEPPADHVEQVRQLFDLVSCQGKVPPGVDPAPVKAFCARQEKLAARTAQARATMQKLLAAKRPARVPSAVVYPLSDADVAGALVAFPEARNLTLTSSAPCGAPSLAALRDPARLSAVLDSLARDEERLVARVGDGAPGPAPAGQRNALLLLLRGLAVDGQEPVGLKYLRVEKDGTLRYLGAGELAAMEKARTTDPFESCEVAFIRRGEATGTAPRLARSLKVDLSDAGAAADPAPLAHLDSKGKFGAVLADATAISGDRYARLRDLLVKRAAFLVVWDGGDPSVERGKQAGLVTDPQPRPGAKVKVLLLSRPQGQ